MNGFSTVKEMAKIWDVSERQVQFWCKTGMIDGAAMFAASWAIPSDAKKPTRTVKQKPGRKTKTTKGEQHG